MKDINKKFSVRYFLNLVLVDEEERRYFKQQVCDCLVLFIYVIDHVMIGVFDLIDIIRKLIQ